MPIAGDKPTRTETRESRRFQVREGLREQLELLLIHKLDDLVEAWKEQIRSGVIDGRLREVLVAAGWVTYRDPRIAPISASRAAIARPTRTGVPSPGTAFDRPESETVADAGPPPAPSERD